jgi:hypothetical protein
MGDCSDCRFFRPFRPLSQLLMRDLGTNQHESELTGTFLKMMEDERERQDAEAEYRRELVRMRKVEWPYRPMMSDYCANKEGEGQFLVAELKNAGGQCQDHARGPKESRPCATCRHRAGGDGMARDLQELDVLARLAATDVVLGQGGGIDKLEEYRRSIDRAKTLEAAQAFNARKLTYRKPSYVPFCLRHQQPDEYMPCAVRNPHDVCTQWDAQQAPVTISLQDAIAAVTS